MKSDLRTISANTGYSIATVSRALNGEKYVSEKVRKEIIAEAARLGRRSGRNTILLITTIQLMSSTYFVNFLQRLWKMLDVSGFRCELITNDSIDIIEEQLIVGAISLMTSDGLERYWGRNFSVPLVCINTSANHLHNIWSVLTDEKAAMRKLLNHLYNFDHRKVVLLSAPEGESYQYCAAARREAFVEMTAELNMHQAEIMTIIWQEPEVMAQKLIKSGATAAVVASESFADVLIEQLQALGCRIPEDISICGWVYKTSRSCSSIVTGVEQNIDALVENAVNNLKKLIAKEKVTKDIFVPCVWKERLSTAPVNEKI